jgi:hypothetical protein
MGQNDLLLQSSSELTREDLLNVLSYYQCVWQAYEAPNYCSGHNINLPDTSALSGRFRIHFCCKNDLAACPCVGPVIRLVIGGALSVLEDER